MYILFNSNSYYCILVVILSFVPVGIVSAAAQGKGYSDTCWNGQEEIIPSRIVNQ